MAFQKRLDKTRPHGTVHGEHGASYEQDGFLFNHEGHLIEELLTPELRDKLAAMAKKAAAKAPAEEGDGDDDGKGIDPDAINLELWLRGEAKYNFDAVRKEVKRRFGVWKTGKADVVEVLVEEGIVTLDDLAPEFKKLMTAPAA